MAELDPGSLGIIFVVLALVFAGAVYLVTRAAPRFRSITRAPASVPLPNPEIPASNEAVILVQIGGRVLYTNDLAREWLGHLEKEPNLERLARRAHPSDVFLGLCSAEGQARFSLDGRLIEGTSYYVPSTDGNEGALLVSMRRPQVTPLASGGPDVPEHALDIFAELSQAMASSLDLDQTLQAILESVEQLVPSDYSEITIWDEDNQYLIPYRFVGMAEVDRRVEKTEERYKPGEGYSGYLSEHRKPLLISDVDTFKDAFPILDRKQYPFDSYLGVPLILAGDLVGTVELAGLEENKFSQGDLEVIKVLAGQAAIALHNALLFQDVKKRVLELSGLAKLAQASGAQRDPQDFFARLIEGITPLMQVESVGFLVYDEPRRRLAAQKPFIGIPEEFVQVYQVIIPPGTPGEEVWLAQENIIAHPAPEDERLQALGLAGLAQAAGLNSMALIPLTSGGRMLGYLQVADKVDGSLFNDDDLRILTIISGQAATVIENLMLVRQTQERALRSEAMRRIASLTGSVATLDEILSFSLRELARLLRVDMAAILLINENRAELRVHSESLYGIAPDVGARLGRISMSDPEYMLTVTGSQRPVFSDDISKETVFPPLYRLVVDVLGISSIIIVPIIVRERGIGEMFLSSRQAEFFDPSDLILLTTTADQIAAAIEKSSLYNQTDESLLRRVDQLTALTRIGRELNTSLELHPLLKLIYEELLRTTGASCGNIALFEPNENIDGDRKAFIEIGDERDGTISALETKAMAYDEPIIVNNYEKPVPAVGNAIIAPPHPGILSSLVVPISYQEGIAGLINLHAEKVDAFDKTAMDIAQSLATQAAIALGNSMRYYEQHQRSELLSRRVEVIVQLMEASRQLSPDQPLEEALEAIAFGIQEATPFNIVHIRIYKPEADEMVYSTGVGLPLDEIQKLRNSSIPWITIEPFLRDEYRFNLSYFIPANQTPLVLVDAITTVELPLGGEKLSDRYLWQEGDELWVPLRDPDEKLLGIISVENPHNGLRPDKPTFEALDIFAIQAALTIESHLKLQELSSQLQDSQTDVERARKAMDVSLTVQPTILHKDVENTITIRNISQRSQRIQAGLDIAELVNRQTSRSDVIQVFGREVLTRMEYDLILAAESTGGNPRLIQILGTPPAGSVNMEALLGQRNPLRTTLQTGEVIQVNDISENAEWKGTPLLNALEARAFICLPIQVAGQIDTAFLLVSYSPITAYAGEELHLYNLLTRQVAIALENLRLLDETNRRLEEVNLLLEFSRQLGSLEPKSIMRTLVDSALKVISNANAGMVALWQDEQNCLVPQAASGYIHNDQILQITYQSGQALPGMVFASGQAMRIAEVNFPKHYSLSAEYLLIYRNATEGRLPISSLVVPIQTTENKLGVLVLDNFSDAAAFTMEDQNLAAGLTRQTALTLENARLFQAAEQRAVQLLALTNVAATITSSLQTDELINSLLGQVKTIIPFDTGTLWLRQGDTLTIRAAAGFEDSDKRLGLSVTLEDSQLLKEMIETSRPTSVDDVRADPRFTTLLEPRYLSWLGIPLISKGQVVGVIALEKEEENYFTPESISAAITFAGQTAVALENARLYEESVRRAAELDERSQRLTLLHRFSTELSGSLDMRFILGLTMRELAQAVHSDALSVVLFDQNKKPFVEAEEPKFAEQYPLDLPESPIFERLRESLGIFSTDDVTQEEDLTPLLSYLSERSTRALLIIPLSTGGEMTGLLFAHATQSFRFEADEVELARTISNQAAVAIQNARLFQETERLFGETQHRSAELGMLFDLGMNITRVLDRSRLIEATFENVIQMLGADSASLVLSGDESSLEVRALDRGEWIGPTSIPRSGASFSEYVLNTGIPLSIRDMEKEKETLPVQGVVLGESVKSWLGIPLLARGEALGVLSVQSYQANAFGEPQLRLMGQVGNQLAVALDNARLFETTQSYAQDMALKVSERTKELESEHNRSQTLLRIITELSSSLDLDMVLNRTLAILNETIGAEHSMIMLVNPEEDALNLRSSLGYASPPVRGGQISQFKQKEGLAGWVITNRMAALIPDLWEDERWIKREDEHNQHRSAIAVPLLMGEESLGALILFHRRTNMFVQDMLDLTQAAAKQIAVSINNSQLFNLIRDQAERLGDMLRTQHVETSRSQAMLEAVADGILVTDAQRVITLFNASAETMLGLKRDQVVGRSLENFIGLFGKAAHDWVKTIRTWSEDPHSYTVGESKSEQIVLDDQRVVSVHLSPVVMRKDFLGTVSIFQDITHLIELDRLKSEFVATVSHELRTPMTSIKGYVEILLMGAAGQLTEQQSHFLQVVRSNTERLAVLVNDLLDISRIEAGRVTLSMQPLRVEEIVKSSYDMVIHRSQDEGKAIKIEVKVDPNTPSAYGDQERVQQILDNLVENAYQYTAENGEITISARVDDNEVRFEVRDNGIGILRDDQARVFQRFFRGEDPLVLATSGTGLGLSIVKHLVEMHGGHIWFESAGVAGLGSTFYFTLPLYDPSKIEEMESQGAA